MPRSEPTETSRLLGLGDPGAKRGDSKDSNGDGLRSHSAATGFLEKDPTRGWCFDEGEWGEMREAPGRYLKVDTSHPPGEVGHPKDSEEQRWSRRVKPLPPLWVGTRPPPPPSPRHIPSLTATKKRCPRDPEGLRYLTPEAIGDEGSAGEWVCKGIPKYHLYHPRAASPTPAPESAGGGGQAPEGGGPDLGKGHSRLERVLNGGGHGPLRWAASGPGRRCRCRCARAQPGLRRPLCRPARYDFIHSWGCGASEAGRAGGVAQPIPAPPGARRDLESRGARRRPRAPLRGLHVPGAVGSMAHPLVAGDTGRG